MIHKMVIFWCKSQIQPTHPNTFRVGINPKLLEKARNFFNASLTDILNELLQNSRRAGATCVTITFNTTTTTLTVEDNGSGIFRDGIVIDLGGSGWDGAMQASEDPAGCGLFSLASRTCEIEPRLFLPSYALGHIDPSGLPEELLSGMESFP